MTNYEVVITQRAKPFLMNNYGPNAPLSKEEAEKLAKELGENCHLVVEVRPKP
jgi:hypothetical protein